VGGARVTGRVGGAVSVGGFDLRSSPEPGERSAFGVLPPAPALPHYNRPVRHIADGHTVSVE